MNNVINNSFGMNFQMEQIEKIKGLPLYMTARRSFYIVKDDSVSFMLVKVSEDEKYGVLALEKQKKIYEEKSDLNVGFWFENLSRYQRDSLIEHKIPFVADDTQLYLPFLGIAIQNTFKKKSAVKTDKMMPITQSLFLYLLYMCKGKRVMKKEAAEFLGVTKTSITRASEQLAKMGLILQEMTGKEYYMWTEIYGYDLFLKAREYLINPVQTSFITEKSVVPDSMSISGETGLAKYSLINPSKMDCFAIDKAVIKNYNIKEYDERWECNASLIKLELWKYNPELFARDAIVDPVSLYMTMSDVEDERIEGALEEMLEVYEW